MKNIYKTMLMLALVTASVSAQECIPVGGTALANSISETTLVAALSGNMTSAKAEIVKQTKTKNGLLLDINHFFVDEKGGMLQTNDKATLTNVVGKKGVYMLEINYKVAKSFGALEGYKGTFSSYGIMDMNKGEVILRYKGQLCR